MKVIADSHQVNLNKLMYELSTRALVEEEAKQPLLVAQLRGSRKRGLKFMDELDALSL